jgi:dextranase
MLLIWNNGFRWEGRGMKKRCSCLAAAMLLLLTFAAPACAIQKEAVNIADFYTDKARYAPGETVRVSLKLQPGSAISGKLLVTAWHLDQIIQPSLTIPVTADGDGSEIIFDWQPPETDYQGYLLQASMVDESGTMLDSCQVAVDVSSAWVKFPRYGYLWDFTKEAPAEEKIASLTRYHINGLQYYDWQYRHHIPLGKDTAKWQDWSGRWIYGDVIARYIAAAREKGMMNLNYNMVYAANKTYLRDGTGVDPAWRLVKANGQDFTCTMSESRGSTGILQFFNILNEGWQEYIFKAEKEAIEKMGFDGWHGDTIGENGRMQTPDGNPLGFDENGRPIQYVKDGYTTFLNKAKEALGDKYLVFNPVGAQGIEKVNASNVDVLYAEFWPWDKNRWGQHYDTYNAIQREIFAAAKESGGKSLVVAGYVNYKAPGEYFNPAAVLLMDAVVFSSGGARIELGNGDNMLSNEYFPGDGAKAMGGELQAKVIRLYDFITAYENLLRNGPQPVEKTIALDGVSQSSTGAGNAVWAFATATDGYEMLHLINLTGTDSMWRDENQTKPEPTPVNAIPVRYYTDEDIQALFMTSPDGEDIVPQTLAFEKGSDEKGRYITFTVPSLRYWDMVFMRIKAHE